MLTERTPTGQGLNASSLLAEESPTSTPLEQVKHVQRPPSRSMADTLKTKGALRSVRETVQVAPSFSYSNLFRRNLIPIWRPPRIQGEAPDCNPAPHEIPAREPSELRDRYRKPSGLLEALLRGRRRRCQTMLSPTLWQRYYAIYVNRSANESGC